MSDGPNYELLETAARECSERALKIAEAARNKHQQQLAWASVMGVASFGPVTDQVEAQIKSRTLDLEHWRRMEHGKDLFLRWLDSLSKEDREAVLIGTREAHC